VIEQIADYVKQVAGSVALIGPPERYGFLKLPVTPDLVPGSGPLAGLYTALRTTRTDWNLIVACDMPGLTPGFLRSLIEAAEVAGKDCLGPSISGGIEPLCAVYHVRVRSAAESALRDKQLKMQDFVRSLDWAPWPVQDERQLRNVNTPEQFAEEAL
jgi:molybdopterin-guanine dinucleotide biosynthesis protein A